MNKSTITVLIVDDSPTARNLLEHILSSDPMIKVIGKAANGQEALEFLEHKIPDVITMDLIMPKMDGFEVTRRILQEKPIPIIIVSSGYNPERIDESFRALEAGALAIIEKPAGISSTNYKEMASFLIETVKTMADVKIVTRRHIPLSTNARMKLLAEASSDTVWEHYHEIQAVGIGTSLGGPQTLYKIFSSLSKNFPVPIYVVQHISHGFVDGFVEWLNGASKLPVHVAKDRCHALPGHIYIAPDACHMEIKKGNIIHLVKEPPEHSVQPSVSRLFHSLADTFGPNCIGVILTGMGRDGADELLYMKSKGAYTIAQSEASCIMFGMPQEAIRLGAVKSIIPLDNIAFFIECIIQRAGCKNKDEHHGR